MKLEEEKTNHNLREKERLLYIGILFILHIF